MKKLAASWLRIIFSLFFLLELAKHCMFVFYELEQQKILWLCSIYTFCLVFEVISVAGFSLSPSLSLYPSLALSLSRRGEQGRRQQRRRHKHRVQTRLAVICQSGAISCNTVLILPRETLMELAMQRLTTGHAHFPPVAVQYSVGSSWF